MIPAESAHPIARLDAQIAEASGQAGHPLGDIGEVGATRAAPLEGHHRLAGKRLVARRKMSVMVSGTSCMVLWIGRAMGGLLSLPGLDATLPSSSSPGSSVSVRQVMIGSGSGHGEDAPRRH